MSRLRNLQSGKGRWFAASLGGLVFVAVLGLSVFAFHRSVARSNRDACVGLDPIRLRAKIPALSVTSLTPGREGLVPGGEEFLGARLGGGAVLLNFWSATCPPCVRELPSLVELGRRAWPGAVVLVLVDDSLDEASRLIRNNPRLLAGRENVIWLWDKRRRLARALGTSKFPETYLITQRTVRWKVESERDWMSLPARRCLLTHW